MQSELFNIPVGQRQLFIDDLGIKEINNLVRRMHQPRKLGAVIRPDRSIGITSHQTRTAPIWDPNEKVYKFLVHGCPDDMNISACSYFESNDGLHWTKPSLNQVEYDGSMDNNYLSIDNGIYRLAPVLFVYDPNETDPLRRFKGAAHFMRRINDQQREPSVGFLVSPDARNWKMLDGISVRSSDEQNMSYDHISKQFILTVKHGGTKGGRAVWLSTSLDFEHWTEPELIFEADETDQELGRKNIEERLADCGLWQPLYNNPEAYKVDVYNMGVFRYEGLYIGMPAMYHAVGKIPNYPNTDGFHLVQLAYSRDMKNWQRLGERKTFIGPSPTGAGAYDLTQIIGPSSAIIKDDELWFYYTGLKYRANWEYVGEYPNGKHIPLPGLDPDVGAVCLAVLRRDGFVSLDAKEAKGTVVTKSFRLSDTNLYINADALNGNCVVEVLDRDGKILAESTNMTGDLLHGKVDWQSGNFALLQEQIISLRFILHNASIYSYWLDN